MAEKQSPVDEKAYDGVRNESVAYAGVPLEALPKSRWERSWPTIACGAGLFSDGYIQGYANKDLSATIKFIYLMGGRAIGPVNTMLKKIYPTQYGGSSAQENVTSIAFVGTVVGQLAFGYLSDHWSRKWSLLTSTVILIVFAILAAGSWGAGGSVYGLFGALTAYRFLVGIGIGYRPSSSFRYRFEAPLATSATEFDIVANIQPAPSPAPRAQANSKRATATDGSSCSPTSSSTPALSYQRWWL